MALLAIAAASPARTAGPAAAEFTLKELDGGKRSLRELRGNVVMILFLSDQCGACHDEVAAVEEMHRRHASAGLRVVGILGDEPQPASSLRNATFPLLVGNEEVDDAYHVAGRPLVYLLDRDHKLQAKHRGWSEGRAAILEAEVRQLLGGEDINPDGLDLYKALGSWQGHWVPGTLRRLRTDQVIAYLTSADEAERRWAVGELASRKARDGVAMIGSILLSGKEALSLRREALGALRKIGSPEAAGSYLRIAGRREEPPLLRGEAVFALSDVLDEAKVRDALPALLGDPDANVRLASASVLGDGCIAAASAALREAAARETNEWVKSGMARALARLGECGGSGVAAPAAEGTESP